jgi:molybdenum cofactor cytidylyltransferase
MSSIAALLLAAGESKRMGQNKSLLPWINDQPLIAFQTNSLIEAGFNPIVIVLGHQASEVRLAIPDLPSVSVVENHEYKLGRSGSVIRGLEELPDDINGVIILNVDSPRNAWVLRSLRIAFESSNDSLAVLSYRGEVGHPWLFPITLMVELLTINEAGLGLREVENRHQEKWLLVETESPTCLTNINSPEDYVVELTLAQDSDAKNV